MPWRFGKTVLLTLSAGLLAGLAMADDTLPPSPSPQAKPTQPSEYVPIKGQADAFITESEVLSAYATYFKSGTVFSDDNVRQAYGNNVKSCLENGSDCDQDALFKSLIQYNLGKAANGMLLEAQTNAANIKSLGYDGKPSKAFEQTQAHERPQPFEFQITDNFGQGLLKVDPQNQRSNEILGDEFMRQYRMFIHAYSQTDPTDPKTPTNVDEYALTTKGTLEGEVGDAADVQKRTNGVVNVDEMRLHEVEAEQGSKLVKDKVEAFNNSIGTAKVTASADGKKAEVDPSPLHYTDTGLGEQIVVDPDKQALREKQLDADYYKAQAKNVNDIIEKSIAAKKSGANGDKYEESSYYADSTAFNSFLDEIWPPAAGKRASNP